ncbi:hypothetical protein CMI44_01780 [Candidatus Pacearchaeota archaeon]|jgi:hypothetical protein|nr:hypothetical protein [Candidatus Pacearchaeota archaeon]|tara:strand:+ start:560 stop:1117 length:558 start_codon:yes stop_codon:yes gene_type:complete
MAKNKHAAMEMSVGTIVTIVLLMTVLVLGLILIRTIFKSSVENIEGIDTAVKSEIEKLFSENENKKIVIYPPTREVEIKKGEENRGFGLSVRNVGNEDGKFSYDITAEETNCNIQLAKAEDLIALNKKRNNIVIPAGSIMDDPIFVKFDIPETTPPCKIVYSINMEKGTQLYGSSIDVYVTIKSE